MIDGVVDQIKFTFLFLITFLLPLPSHALELFVKVHILSHSSFDQVEITGVVAKIKILEKGGLYRETLLPPNVPLQLKSSKKWIELVLRTDLKKVKEVMIEVPQGRKSFITLQFPNALQKKIYGKLTVRSLKGNLFFIEELPLEDYVEGVLESKIPKTFPLEALKAQAIVIRSLAFSSFKKHAKEGFDFCDQTHCQFYEGKKLNTSSFEKAVQATKGLVLSYPSESIESAYYTMCGGQSLGTCEWGAKKMAEEGKKFDEILIHYFPGAQLIQR